ncbi:MAG: hypothetical protein M1819_000107 [Sarea resinae]|nr:MAG: hypothetical protein M1819_000107 [Sarea resinae]
MEGDFENDNALEWNSGLSRSIKGPGGRSESYDNVWQQSLSRELFHKKEADAQAEFSRHAISLPPTGQKIAPFKSLPKTVKHNYTNHLIVNEDSRAKAAWRSRQPATGTFLPSSGDIIGGLPLPKKHRPGPVSTRIAVPLPIIERINHATGAFVEQADQAANRLEPKFSIWGSEEQVLAAKSELAAWIKHRYYDSYLTVQAGEKETFPRIPSLTDKKKTAIAKEKEEQADQRSYRRAPEGSDAFNIMGYFLWPSSELRIEATLGHNLEALDPVRMSCRCHVIYESGSSLLKILGHDLTNVDQAIKRIRVTICEIMVRSSRPTRLYLVNPPSIEGARKEVKLIPEKIPKDSVSPSMAPVLPMLTGSRFTGRELNEWAGLRSRALSSNLRRLREAIDDCLKKLRFHRGHIRVRVHFGSLYLTGYKKPKGGRLGIRDFMLMMENFQTSGEIDRNLKHLSSEGELISRCCGARSVLEPMDVMCGALEEVRPIYSAMFEVASSDGMGHLRLEIEFRKSTKPGEFEVPLKKWFRINNSNGTNGMEKSGKILMPLNLNFVDLEKDSAWQFEVAANNAIEYSQITPKMHKFADCIRLNINPDPITSKEPLITFTETIDTRFFIQKSSYRYSMRRSAYVLEASKYELFSRQTTLSGRGSVNAGEHWQVSMYNAEWDNIVGQQANLEIGECGPSLPTLNTFFPSDADSAPGLSDFLDKINETLDIIWGSSNNISS